MELLALRLSNSQEGLPPNVFSTLTCICPKMVRQILKINLAAFAAKIFIVYLTIVRHYAPEGYDFLDVFRANDIKASSSGLNIIL